MPFDINEKKHLVDAESSGKLSLQKCLMNILTANFVSWSLQHVLPLGGR